MATKPPSSAVVELPAWIWNGAVLEFINASRLDVIPDNGLGVDEFRVQVFERGSSERPKLVTARQLAGYPLTSANFGPLHDAETESDSDSGYLDQDGLRLRASRLSRVERAAEKGGQAGYIAPGLAFHQLQTIVAEPSMGARTVEVIAEDLSNYRFDGTDERVFSDVGVHFIQRDPALFHRSKIPAVLLRVARDPKLQQADLEDIKRASARGEIVFAASDGLGDGFALLDAYGIAPGLVDTRG